MQHREALGAECRECREGPNQTNSYPARESVGDMDAPIEPLVDDVDDVAADQIDDERGYGKAVRWEGKIESITEHRADRAHHQHDHIQERRGGSDLGGSFRAIIWQGRMLLVA